MELIKNGKVVVEGGVVDVIRAITKEKSKDGLVVLVKGKPFDIDFDKFIKTEATAPKKVVRKSPKAKAKLETEAKAENVETEATALKKVS